MVPSIFRSHPGSGQEEGVVRSQFQQKREVNVHGV